MSSSSCRRVAFTELIPTPSSYKNRQVSHSFSVSHPFPSRPLHAGDSSAEGQCPYLSIGKALCPRCLGGRTVVTQPARLAKEISAKQGRKNRLRQQVNLERCESGGQGELLADKLLLTETDRDFPAEHRRYLLILLMNKQSLSCKQESYSVQL